VAHLEEGKLLVRGGLAEPDAEVRRDGVDDLVRAATAEHARGGGADLDKVVADRFPGKVGQGVSPGESDEGGESRIEANRLNLVGDRDESANNLSCIHETRTGSHGVERRDLVHPHRGHLEHLCDVVHDRDAGPPLVLLLRDLEQRDDGSLLVLGRVLCDNGLGDFLVLCRELERDLGIVVRRVAVLRASSELVSILATDL